MNSCLRAALVGPLSGRGVKPTSAECFNADMPRDLLVSTLDALCVDLAHRCGDRVALLDGCQEITYGELTDQALRVAAVLADSGVRPGARVVLSGRNTTDWVCIALGILCAGATVVPVGHGVSGPEYSRILDVTEPALVVDQPRIADIMAAARTTAPHPDRPAAGPDDIAVILSTSGSTGVSKQVPMTHGQLSRLYSAVADRLELTSADRVIGAVPFAHSFGFNGVLLTAMCAGASVRVVEHYDRADLADVIVRDRVSVVMGPPTILFDLVGSGRDDIGLVCRMAVSGGSEVPLDRMRGACRELGIVNMVVGYGLTEACGTVAMGSITEGESGSLAMLTPVDGLEIRIVDDYGYPLPPDEDGHVLCSGYNIMHGYLRGVDDPESTPDDAVDGDGWLRTGDIGWSDDDGHLYIVSRAKDTVIVSGFNVYPQEVETVLMDHPLILEVAVIGVADQRQGQRLVACIIPVHGYSVDSEDLIDFCKERLSAYKVPRIFVELEMFPTTHTGKRSREELRKQVSQRL